MSVSKAATVGRKGMIKLSPAVYYIPTTLSTSTTTSPTPSEPASEPPSEPASETPSQTPSEAPSGLSTPSAPRDNDPGLILLGTWMGAAPRHIEKYTDVYRRLFPSSPILLVRSEATHFLKPREARELVKPASAVVESYAASTSADWLPLPLGAETRKEEFDGVLARLREARLSEQEYPAEKGGTGGMGEKGGNGGRTMLVHLWSNGGSGSFASVRSMARVFPNYTLIFDSAPGQFHFKSTYTAFMLTIPHPWLRRLLAPFVFSMCCYFWARANLRRFIGGGAGPLQVTADSHNDPQLLSKEVRRAYVYSDEDALVPSADVEEHAAEARRRGFDVRLEKFTGPHVAHAREDPARYWRIVKENWYGPKADGKAEPKEAEAKEEVKTPGPAPPVAGTVQASA